MSWMFFAGLSPLVWSFSNYIDEYLVKHHFSVSPVMMIVAAAVFSIIPGGIALMFYPEALEISWPMRIVLGLLDVYILITFVPYIKAIQLDGASVAVPMFQTIPVFTFLFGWIILGETVSLPKILACLLIVASAIGITWNFKTKSIRRKTVYLMLLSSMGLAISNIMNRYVVQEIDWISMMIWMWIGSSVAGILAVVLYKPWRQSFSNVILKARPAVLSLFVIQAALDMVATGLFIYALTLAPATGLVSTMNGLQPFFVIALGRCWVFSSQKISSVWHWIKAWHGSFSVLFCCLLAWRCYHF